MTQDASSGDGSDGGRLDDLIESVTDAFYAVDRPWRLVVQQLRRKLFFGLRREDVLGRDLWDIFPDGRDRTFGKACARAMAHGEVHQMEAPSAFRPGRVVELRIGPCGPAARPSPCAT